MSHLNYFEPYQSKTETHEDQLTRAFLIILRYSPTALFMFFDYIRKAIIEIADKEKIVVKNIPTFSELNLKDITFKDQVKTLKDLIGSMVISVLVTDEKLDIPEEINSSKRGARYDGVISFGKDLTLVIENKPKSYNVWEEQLRPNLKDCAEDVEIIKVAAILEWKEIISKLNSLNSIESIGGAEKIIVSDFLEFIDKNFSFLNPYTSFLVCKDEEYLLKRRCVGILERLYPGKVEYHRGWKDVARLDERWVQEIALSPYDIGSDQQWKIVLEIYPGDTMNQARDLYARIDIDKLLKLKDKEWDIQPNMHFSFRASNLVWSEVKLSIDEYARYWKNKIGNLNQIKRKDFNKIFDELIKDKLISPKDKMKLEEEFLKTKRQTMNICAGIKMWYEWPKLLAVDLDKNEQFSDLVKSKIEEAFSVIKKNK